MISYPVYKIVHLLGIMMIFLSLGGVTMHVILGGDKNHLWKKPLMITHGLGLLIALVGGFGLLARLGIVQGGLPGWVWVKLGIWLILGGISALLIRKRTWAKSAWFVILILGAFGAYLAGSKPF